MLNGTGVHVAGDRLLAVRLSAEDPARVADVAVPGPGRAELVAGCIGAAATVGATTSEALRLAWSTARIELVDVTAAGAANLAATLRRFAADGCTAVTTESVGQRTVAVGIAWDHDLAAALVGDVRAAGFADVVIEPATLARWRSEQRPALMADLHPRHRTAAGAALAAAGRAAPIRRLDLTAASPRAATAWVLERVTTEPAAAARRGTRPRWSAALRRIRSARCAS